MFNRTVAAGYVRALLDYAVLSGADRQTLIEISGIPPGELKDPDNRVPLKNCARLMKAAVRDCDDPAFALRFGETVKTEDLGIALLIAGVAGTVGEARTLVNRHGRLIRDDDDGTDSNFLDVVRDRAAPGSSSEVAAMRTISISLKPDSHGVFARRARCWRSTSRDGHS